MPADPAAAKSLFLELAAIDDPVDRAAWLRERCGADAELLARVAALLAANDRATAGAGTASFPGPGEDPDARTARFPENDGHAGAVIAGRYKLLQQIGEGGMGSVWMADQTEPVKRRVAVKLIRVERGQSKTILSRFEAERQAIALMDHPHIAKLLDAGTTDTGSPFFVMELVKGVPLNEFCDAHRLSVPDRLHLFMQVCSAVQHAHQKGVIHRDLKPSNILVEAHDGKPVPKVIDFGLAKATTGLQLTEHTLFTAFGSVMGTPLYMAPEQASFNAVDVDTRADIYALGVILYELLTGTTPLTRETIKTAALDEMLKMIREQEAPTPSSRLSTSDSKPSVAANRQTEPLKLGRFVRGELDWIVMKALSKERDRRYETASGFAKDIERFLAHEPVLAGPPGARYRVRKFVQRNRGRVIAAGLVFLALLAGIVGTTWGLIRAEAARRDAVAAAEREAAERQKAEVAKTAAEENAAESHALVLFFRRVFSTALPQDVFRGKGLGRDVTLRDALKASLLATGEAYPVQPLAEARLRGVLGEWLSMLGEATLAAEQQEQARSLFTRHRGPDHPDTLGIMSNLAISYYALGRHPEALRLREETLAAQNRVLPQDHQQTLTSMGNLAFNYEALHRLPQALELYEQLLAAHQRVRPANHPDTLTSMYNVARLYGALGRPADALKLHEDTLARSRMLSPYHYFTLDCMMEVANSYDALGRHADALKLRGEALEARKRVLPPNHPDTLTSMWRLAESLIKLDRGSEAIPLIDECVAKGAGVVGAPRLVPSVMLMRMQHFQKTGDPAGCRATAAMWENLNRTDADSLYNAACFRAVAAGVYAKVKQPGEAAADADRAIVWLTKAVAAGWKDVAHAKTYTDLDFLRGRADFQKLLADLEAKSPPPK